MKFCKCLAILLFSTFAFLCSADELPQQWSNTILQLVFTNETDCTNGIYTDVSFAGGHNFYQTNATLRPTWYPRYLEFDGSNDYAKCTNDPVLGLTNFTVAVWFRYTNYVQYAGIFSDYGSAPQANWFIQETTNTTARLLCGNGNATDFKISSAFTASNWCHFVGVFQGSSQIVVYVNKVRVSKTITVPYIGSTQNTYGLQLGRYGSTYEFKGRIGEAVIWNLPLTGTEVTNEYNRGTNVFNDAPPQEGISILID